jgi:ribonuclease E
VLMPNSPRGGGISRKITSAADRKRLKEITAEMEIPKGMGLIVRTAGAARPKPEIRRDCEYLMRLWDDIRDQTMRSMAPALIYEEASLIKRSIRDVYSRDVDEIIVDGEEGWKQAHDFMRMLMPSHAKKVQLWRPQGIQTPLFAKYQVDLQLDAMLAPTVQLKSGGYLVINQTEALVAIDVNSGRSTRERGIEETALKTNLEAADEVARQLRLRDLAGLIVIDFIDMEARKANAMVERRMKDALKNDRARIQLGAISHFGLMEMSRQRLRPSLAETSFVTCPHCNGLGHVRSVESAAIHVLRSVEEEGSKLRAAAILVYAASPVVMYILNHKRDRLTEIEARYAMRISFAGDDTLLPPAVRIDRLRPQVADAERLLTATAVSVAPPMVDSYDEEEDEEDLVLDEAPAPARVQQPRPARQPAAASPAPVAASDEATPAAETAASIEEGEQRRRRRRRRRGGRRDGTGTGENASGENATGENGASLAGDTEGDEGDEDGAEPATDAVEGVDPVLAEANAAEAGDGIPAGEQVELDENGEPKARRRGRRGGRRRRRVEGEAGEAGEEAAPAEAPMPAPLPVAPPVYAGPTPANPFNNTYDIFDMLEQAEQAAIQAPVVKQVPIMAAPAPAPEPEPQPHVAIEPAPQATPEPAPEPQMAVTSEAVPAEPEPPPAVEAVAPEPTPEPTAPPAPAKRGWWRR